MESSFTGLSARTTTTNRSTPDGSCARAEGATVTIRPRHARSSMKREPPHRARPAELLRTNDPRKVACEFRSSSRRERRSSQDILQTRSAFARPFLADISHLPGPWSRASASVVSVSCAPERKANARRVRGPARDRPRTDRKRALPRTHSLKSGTVSEGLRLVEAASSDQAAGVQNDPIQGQSCSSRRMSPTTK